jgi:hypothetical protein
MHVGNGSGGDILTDNERKTELLLIACLCLLLAAWALWALTGGWR